MLFANFAEAMAEGRGKAQANALRAVAQQDHRHAACGGNGTTEEISADELRKGDVIVVAAGEMIRRRRRDHRRRGNRGRIGHHRRIRAGHPRSGGDRSAVTGGTRVLSDVIKIRISVNPGESFLDRMIGLVEGAKRQKTPNEIALTILLAALTVIFCSSASR